MKHLPLILVVLFTTASCSIPYLTPPVQETPVDTGEMIISTGSEGVGSTGGEISTGILLSTGETLSGGLVDSGASSTGEIQQEGQKSDPIIPTISGEAQIMTKQDICISDLCIRVKKPYFTVGDEYIQFATMTGESMDQWVYVGKLPEITPDGIYLLNAETSREVRVKKDGSSGSLSESQIMFGKKTELSKISDQVYLVKETSGGCGGSSVKQGFVDTNGKRVSFDVVGKGYPKNLQVGSIAFHAYWTEDSISYLWRMLGRDGVEEIPDTFSISDDVGSKILSHIKEKKEFTQSYVIKYKEYPGIIFVYKSDIPSAERVISLGTDDAWKTNNLDAQGNLLDMGLTKKILGYYEASADGTAALINNRQIQKKGDRNYDKITSEKLTGGLMPIFQVKPLDTTGNYLLYTTNSYESVTVAELCKPLVYVYDTEKRENTLRVDFPQGGAFTKILPSFTWGNTWEFRADSHSKIQVQDESKTNEYLYYSAKVPNYLYNQNGWQIYGHDIRAFFEEKLDIIGFTPKEKKDFIEYWVSEFESDTLYFVSFKFDSALDPYVTLDFREKPISQMRVLLEAYPLETPPKKEYLWPNTSDRFDNRILKTFVRSGEYDVFEWGGTVQKKSRGSIHIH